MSSYRHFALVLLVALGALAVTASSASASKLCKVNEAPCSTANRYPVGTKFEAKSVGGTKFLLEFFGGTAKVEPKCANSRIKATVVTAEGVVAQMNEEFFGECVYSGKGCAIQATNLGQAGTFTAGSPQGNGTFAFPITLNMECEAAPLFKCAFASTVTFQFSGGNPAVLAAEKLKLGKTAREGEFNCPASALWWDSYSSTAPTGSLFLTL